MKKISAIIAVAVGTSLALGSVAIAQTKPTDKPTDHPSAAVPNTPAKIEGRVTKIDRDSGMVTVQANDGRTHEFRGNDETLKDLKVGDNLELSLRQAPR
jgi:hypothetical protein